MMILVGGKLLNVAHISAVVPVTKSWSEVLMIDGTWIRVGAPHADLCLEVLEAVKP